MTTMVPPKWFKFLKLGKVIVIIKFVVRNRVPAHYISVLSQFLKVQSLTDPFEPHFAQLGHKESPSLPLECFFLKKNRLVEQI